MEATETCKASVSLLLGVQLVLKMSGTEVLILSTPEVEVGIDAVVSKGLNVLTLVLASVFSAEAKEDGMVRLVPLTVTRPWGVDTEPDSVLDAMDEVVLIAEIALGEPVTSKIEAMSVIVLEPVGAGAAVDDQVGGCCRADVLVSVARVLSMVLTLPFGPGIVVRTELVSIVVIVVVTSGVGAMVTSMLLTPARYEVCDSCPRVEATSLFTTLVMVASVVDPTEGNVTDGEELIFPPEALVMLVMSWLSEVRDANVVCSTEVLCNVSLASGDLSRIRLLPVVCSGHGLADE